MNRNAVETIKQKLSIETVVGSYIKLEKSGKNFRACCPFHNEKTPSFYVTPALNIFYCYGCHKGGDIFNFVQEIEGLSFVEAKKMLAEKAGVPLDDYQNEKPSHTAILREIMDTAAKFYEVGLRTNPDVVTYLMSRGLTKETMVSFRIGYSEKGWSRLYDYLKNRSTTLTAGKKYSDDDIASTGLCIKGPKGTYDRFRERIMFPIMDGQGRVIAFTGRVMPGTEEADRPVGKYINSPETDLYHKSSVLFGYDKAKATIHSQGFAIIVEGQMDLIMSHQVGVTNVVALSGTASTDEHLKQLGRFTTNIVLCLDDDAAGLNASEKTAMIIRAYSNEMHVEAITLPKGKDPADLIRENPEGWKQAIKHRKDFITFRLEKIVKDATDQDKMKTVEKVIFPLLKSITHRMISDKKIQEIAHTLQVKDDAVRKDFEEYLKKNPLEKPLPEKKQEPVQIHDLKKHLEERIVEIISTIQSSQSFGELKKEFELVIGPLDERLARITPEKQSQYLFQAEQFLGALPDAEQTYIWTVRDLLTRYALVAIDEDKQKLDRELQNDPNNVEVLQKIHELLKKRDTIIHQLNNQS